MVELDDGRVRLTTRMPKALRREVRRHCVRADIAVTAFVVAALEERLRREQKKPRRPQRN